jgi:hypothetical protein
MTFLRTHMLLILACVVTVVVVAGLTVTITWAFGITFEGSQQKRHRGNLLVHKPTLLKRGYRKPNGRCGLKLSKGARSISVLTRSV